MGQNPTVKLETTQVVILLQPVPFLGDTTISLPESTDNKNVTHRSYAKPETTRTLEIMGLIVGRCN